MKSVITIYKDLCVNIIYPGASIPSDSHDATSPSPISIPIASPSAFPLLTGVRLYHSWENFGIKDVRR